MSSKIRKPSLMSKSQFRKKLQDTSVSQENILNILEANNENKKIDSLIDNKHSKTLNNLDNNELENKLQSTLHLLDVEYNKLVKVHESTQRDLEKLKTILAEEIKQQQLSYTQSLLSNADSHSAKTIPEEAVIKAQRSIELKLKHSHLTKHLLSLKETMRPYEQIPDSVEGAYARVKELEAELKSVENQIASAYSSTALNDSM